MPPRSLQFGDVRLTLLDDGPYWVDGGALFGVVPRVLWQKHATPDAQNRVLLGLNCLLVDSHGRRVLVDTGAGRQGGARLEDSFGLDPEWTLLDAFGAAGVTPESIDVVTNTHLHFDHCGWNTCRDAGGELAATFPRAEYVIQAAEWETALRPDERSAAAYTRARFEPLQARARALSLVRGEVELAPGVFTHPTPGHTAAHQSVRIESGGRTAFFLGDLVPTPAHLPVVYHMAYDLYPTVLLETKRDLLARACRDGWLLVFDHDPERRVGILRHGAGGRYELQPA